MTDKEDKTVRQFVLFCRTALMYEKKNYYNERKHRAERETHIEMLSLKQSGMPYKKAEKNFILGGGACCRLSLPVCGRGNGERA